MTFIKADSLINRQRGREINFTEGSFFSSRKELIFDSLSDKIHRI